MAIAPDGVVPLVEQLIHRAIAARASDVHFEPGDGRMFVRFRVDALLHDVETLPAAIAPNVVARLKVLAGLLTYRTDVPQEGSLTFDGGQPLDIRVATFPTVRGERIVLRLLSNSARLLRLDELGHSPEMVARLKTCLAQPQGLILVCGPAGSGKTSTLYALLQHLLQSRRGTSIFAVEDPVEIRLDGVTQVEVAPQRGLTYAVALRSLLRQDPQVLMIGEIRDGDTAKLVVEAALTGHLLLSTLHSGTPTEAIVRLREMGIAPYQLTSTLQAVLAQRLLRTVCDSCRGTPGAAGAVCSRCLGTGYAERTAIGELVELIPALRNGILQHGDAAELARVVGTTVTLAQDAQRLIAAGRTTEEERRRVLGS